MGADAYPVPEGQESWWHDDKGAGDRSPGE